MAPVDILRAPSPPRPTEVLGQPGHIGSGPPRGSGPLAPRYKNRRDPRMAGPRDPDAAHPLRMRRHWAEASHGLPPHDPACLAAAPTLRRVRRGAPQLRAGGPFWSGRVRPLGRTRARHERRNTHLRVRHPVHSTCAMRGPEWPCLTSWRRGNLRRQAGSPTHPPWARDKWPPRSRGAGGRMGRTTGVARTVGILRRDRSRPLHTAGPRSQNCGGRAVCAWLAGTAAGFEVRVRSTAWRTRDESHRVGSR